MSNLMSDAVTPRAGEVRVMENGMVCRFIESELEGEKWEVLGALYTGPGTPVGGWEEPVAWQRRMRNTSSDASDWQSTWSEWKQCTDEQASYARENGHVEHAPEVVAEVRPLYAAPPPPSVSTDKGSSLRDTHRVPDGWVLVPKEPTTAMLQGACDKHTPGVPMSKARPCECPRFETRRRIWERMVAGSQATPQPADGCSSNEGAA